MNDKITRQYLDEKLAGLKTDFKEILDLILSPIVDKIQSHEIMLKGRTGLDGLSGTVKGIEGELLLHWGAIGLLAAGFSFLAVKVWDLYKSK